MDTVFSLTENAWCETVISHVSHSHVGQGRSLLLYARHTLPVRRKMGKQDVEWESTSCLPNCE